ncbi:GNAT family N-acetyltransferase [Enterococcus sp. BWR-S5]|uniref:GNAT family N-acetyltransferase n=1 Tax=Enterococcus sp. BWR-S5 TaxID=2787714 RepID=UPI001F357FBE|nr:GNAT family N-acetyltransferase [Enterococcus sp. BWR-S5]
MIQDKLAGIFMRKEAKSKKISHSAYIVIGLQKKMHRKGIATYFFRKLDQWAKEQHIKRLELTVITQNTGAIALYKKAGFEIEGTKKNAIFQNGVYQDEYYMSKILS